METKLISYSQLSINISPLNNIPPFIEQQNQHFLIYVQYFKVK